MILIVWECPGSAEGKHDVDGTASRSLDIALHSFAIRPASVEMKELTDGPTENLGAYQYHRHVDNWKNQQEQERQKLCQV